MNLQIGQVLTQIVAFLIMLWVLKRFAWIPILKHLEDRQERIRAEFEAAEMKNQEAQNLVDQYSDKLKQVDKEARQKVQDAIEEGRRISQQIQEKSQIDAKQVIEQAHLEAEKELEASKVKLKKEVVQMAMSATEKLIGHHLDMSTQEKLVQDFVQEADFK